MAVIANLPKPFGRGQKKLEIVTGTGPSSDVAVGAGAGADVAIPLSPSLSNVSHAGVIQISGLPNNIGVGNVTVAPDGSSVTLHCVNPTAADITVTADSVTVTVLVVGH